MADYCWNLKLDMPVSERSKKSQNTNFNQIKEDILSKMKKNIFQLRAVCSMRTRANFKK